MAKHTTTHADQASSSQTQAVQQAQPHTIDIPDALPIRLHVHDLARHSVTTPGGKRYVVATFDDTHPGNGFITAVYPQQYNYQTLIRQEKARYSSSTSEEAMQKHTTTLQAIQQGKLGL